MFLELVLPLVKYVSALNVFRYITFRTAIALTVALLFCFVIGPRMIAYLRRVKAGQNIRHDGPETHLAKSGTPTMGGVLILAGLAVGVLLFGILRNP